MQYELKLMDTQAGVGCFEAQPKANLSLNQMLDHLRQSPMDDFMHHLVLHRLGEMPSRKVKQMIKDVTDGKRQGDHVLAALLYEACLAHRRLEPFQSMVKPLDTAVLMQHTPGVHIRSHLQPDQNLHRSWVRLFAAHNIDHRPLPSPEQAGLKPLFSAEEMQASGSAAHVRDILKELRPTLPQPLARRPVEETTDMAAAALEKANAPLTPEMAHRASLSPFGLLRHWKASMSVSLGRNKHGFSGMQTCYGRGLNMDHARVSMLMEMAERFSSYASLGERGVLGRNRKCPLRRGSLEAVRAEMPALALDQLRLETPYQGQELYWMEGERPTEDGGDGSDSGMEPVLMPPQLVFLFCNLDEPSLFSALGSTGLASGNTMFEAKVSALCEVLERDAIAVNPLDMSRCFTLEADDPTIAHLLTAYAESGIHVWFQDITDEHGIPCYRCFVIGEAGDVNPATGCGLDGRRAVVSAMTETPFPFSGGVPGPPTRPAPKGLPVRKLEDLPDYSTGSAEGDTRLLETVLMRGGHTPHYADMTRADLEIPVVRAVVPGLEVMYDFDQYSRVSPRLFRNYLRLFE